MDSLITVYFYLQDRERTLDSAIEKVMLSLSTFASEVEREKSKQRTHDALLRKARAGHVAGCTVFGYRNSPILEGDRRAYVERITELREAEIIRWIFEMVAAGLGFKRIAMALNHEARLLRSRAAAVAQVAGRHQRSARCSTGICTGVSSSGTDGRRSSARARRSSGGVVRATG